MTHPPETILESESYPLHCSTDSAHPPRMRGGNKVDDDRPAPTDSPISTGTTGLHGEELSLCGVLAQAFLDYHQIQSARNY